MNAGEAENFVAGSGEAVLTKELATASDDAAEFAIGAGLASSAWGVPNDSDPGYGDVLAASHVYTATTEAAAAQPRKNNAAAVEEGTRTSWRCDLS